MNSRSTAVEPKASVVTGMFLLSIILLLVSACSAQQTVSTYSEDLSSHRPKFPAVSDTVRSATDTTVPKPETMQATKNVNTKVDAVLDSIDRYNLTRRFVDGYTAQIYSGQKREDAMNSKLKITQEAPDLTANIQYSQPKFTVTVGQYFTKLEAQKDMVRLKHIFPNAILVPEKIQVR